MVTLTASQPLDMTQLDLNLIVADATSYTSQTNLTYDGIVYPSAFEVFWNDNGVSRESIFAGTDIQYSLENGQPVITGGTVTGYIELAAETPGGQLEPAFSVEGMNYSAVALYNAALTPSIDDDYTIFSAVMSGGDTIYGSSGSDVLVGFGPNDTFFPDGGADHITGDGGINTAVYSGRIEQYQIQAYLNSTETIMDGPTSEPSNDVLYYIQQAQFSDATVVFDLTNSQSYLVYELYQAAYARMPDNAGFRYWATAADAYNWSATTLADQFIAAPEFTQVYGANPDNTTYITELYTHVLGRAPDQAGLTYWVDQANAGQARDQLLVDFAVSAENQNLIAPHVEHGYWTT